MVTEILKIHVYKHSFLIENYRVINTFTYKIYHMGIKL